MGDLIWKWNALLDCSHVCYQKFDNRNICFIFNIFIYICQNHEKNSLTVKTCIRFWKENQGIKDRFNNKLSKINSRSEDFWCVRLPKFLNTVTATKLWNVERNKYQNCLNNNINWRKTICPQGILFCQAGIMPSIRAKYIYTHPKF